MTMTYGKTLSVGLTLPCIHHPNPAWQGSPLLLSMPNGLVAAHSSSFSPVILILDISHPVCISLLYRTSPHLDQTSLEPMTLCCCDCLLLWVCLLPALHTLGGKNGEAPAPC